MNAPAKSTLDARTLNAIRRLANSEIVIGQVTDRIGIQLERPRIVEQGGVAKRVQEYRFLPFGVFDYRCYHNSQKRPIPVVEIHPHKDHLGAMCFQLKPAEGVDGIIQTIITIYPHYYLRDGNNTPKHQYEELSAGDFRGIYLPLLRKK